MQKLDAARVRFDVTGEDESDDDRDGIDMGVDYDGEGKIDAIGDAYITFAGRALAAAGCAPPPPTAASSTSSTTAPTRPNGCTSPRT
jgi:hypothetical protein